MKRSVRITVYEVLIFGALEIALINSQNHQFIRWRYLDQYTWYTDKKKIQDNLTSVVEL